MKRSLRILPGLMLTALLAGCVGVDYVGQSFEPTPEDVPVAYFEDRSVVPAGKYRIIGRGTISTTRKIDQYDIREILVEAARKHGADAVELVSKKKIKIGVYERPNDMDSGSSSPSNVYNLNPDGSPLQVDTFGAPTSLQGETHYREELLVKALFLKNKEELEQLLARRGRELDALVKQPDPGKPAAEEEKTATKPPVENGDVSARAEGK